MLFKNKYCVETARLKNREYSLNFVYHFVDVNKMVGPGSGAQRNVGDIAVTRYAIVPGE